MAAKTVYVWESSTDLVPLAKNQMNLQIAKSVIGKDGTLTYNTVWQSKNLAPRISITWTPVYALNWTLTLPVDNATVTLGGVWQQCNPSQSYDLTDVGLWTASSGGAVKRDYLNVGNNGYSYSGQNGIHIVVGVQNPTIPNEFDMIYVDPIELGLNMSAWYQPQEQAQWWYDTGNQSATMFSGAQAKSDFHNFSSPDPTTGQYYLSTTYIYAKGIWVDSPKPPEAPMVTGLMVHATALNKGRKPGSSDESSIAMSHEFRDQLEQMLQTVNNLMLERASAENVNVRYSFLAKVSWPVAVSIVSVSIAATTIAVAMINKGYIVKKTVVGRNAHYEIGPSLLHRSVEEEEENLGSEEVPSKVTADWKAAVMIDAKDHPIDGGVEPCSSDEFNSTEAMVEMKKHASKVMQSRMNGVEA